MEVGMVTQDAHMTTDHLIVGEAAVDMETEALEGSPVVIANR